MAIGFGGGEMVFFSFIWGCFPPIWQEKISFMNVSLSWEIVGPLQLVPYIGSICDSMVRSGEDKVPYSSVPSVSMSLESGFFFFGLFWGRMEAHQCYLRQLQYPNDSRFVQTWKPLCSFSI